MESCFPSKAQPGQTCVVLAQLANVIAKWMTSDCRSINVAQDQSLKALSWSHHAIHHILYKLPSSETVITRTHELHRTGNAMIARQESKLELITESRKACWRQYTLKIHAGGVKLMKIHSHFLWLTRRKLDRTMRLSTSLTSLNYCCHVVIFYQLPKLLNCPAKKVSC